VFIVKQKTKQLDLEGLDKGRQDELAAPSVSATVAKRKFENLFERFCGYKYSYSEVFSDFLDFAMWRLDIMHTHDISHLDKRYDAGDLKVFIELFNHWMDACDNNGEGFYDVLGDMFMELVSHGRNGQFFTPQPICQLMVELTVKCNIDGKEEPLINEPAAGSGRFILEVGKINRNAKFFAQDNDVTCCKMCVLNMLVNSLRGEVAWMNTLTVQHYSSWFVDRTLVDGKWLPYFVKLPQNTTNLVTGPEYKPYHFQSDLQKYHEAKTREMVHQMQAFLTEIGDMPLLPASEPKVYTMIDQYDAYIQHFM
jgi:type I restriction-modification system DNA methylase subunit